MTTQAMSRANLTTEDEFPNQLSSVDSRLDQEQRHRINLWRSNYHEASIYIEEGLNNDKFENHPKKRASPKPGLAGQDSNQTTPLIPCFSSDQDKLKSQTSSCSSSSSTNGANGASSGGGYLLGGQYTTIETYILVHNRYFYQLDLAASIILLLLAFVEPPAVEGLALDTTIHAAIEMFGLGIIGIELLLKFRWMGPNRFFHHARTVTKLAVLLTMNIEAIVIFMRRSTHARYSRALRPIFLIDNHYCHGLRRAVRQIFQSLPPIIDMFTLALFFMFVFSIFGFYLFASTNSYFSDMPSTVGNLAILATTANMPDIMMPSYAVSRWSTIYFVLFIVVHLFLLTNLTMAAVYESFTRREKEKFHKLLLHRRKACQEAFKLLVSRRQPGQIQYRQFMGLMRYLNRKCSMFDAYLIFKAIDTDKNGSISLEEFYQIYDFINLDWRLIYPQCKWYDNCDCCPGTFKSTLSYVTKVVTHKYFEWFIDFMIAISAALQFIEATTFDLTGTTPLATLLGQPTMIGTPMEGLRPDSISTFIFIVVFSLEAIMKCIAMGLSDYWSFRWNRFDLIIVLMSLGGLLSGYFGGIPFGWFVVLRVLRLMRLFEFKRRYHDIWQTLIYILMKRFVGMTCVVMILYYFFAIIGMELLGDYDLRNCCINTTLESQFKFDNSSDGTARYYLNDFGDVLASYLTLFSMTSSTYWLATMTAYSIVSGTNLVRIYFGLYYLCSVIVMNIVIAFILESFLFRIHYRNKMGKNCDETNLFTVSVSLSRYEVEFLRKTLGPAECDRNLNKKVGAMLLGAKPSSDGRESVLVHAEEGQVDEKMSLLGKDKQSNQSAEPTTNRRPSCDSCFVVYQADQIRNKFSFTMKMYADEVEGWLAEAERIDREDIAPLMMSCNQIRAEHVAMARLVRRSITASDYTQGLRGRSLSSSSGILRQ